MKTKNLISFLVLFAILMGCRKEKEAIPLPEKKQPIEVSKEEFAILCAKKADEIGLSGSISMNTGENYKVLGKDVKSQVTVFKERWGFTELKPVLKEIALNVKVGEGDPALLVENYECFVMFYKPGDNFRVLLPRPKYLVEIEGETYYVKEDYSLWKKRR